MHCGSDGRCRCNDWIRWWVGRSCRWNDRSCRWSGRIRRRHDLGSPCTSARPARFCVVCCRRKIVRAPSLTSTRSSLSTPTSGDGVPRGARRWYWRQVAGPAPPALLAGERGRHQPFAPNERQTPDGFEPPARHPLRTARPSPRARPRRRSLSSPSPSVSGSMERSSRWRTRSCSTASRSTRPTGFCTWLGTTGRKGKTACWFRTSTTATSAHRPRRSSRWRPTTESTPT